MNRRILCICLILLLSCSLTVHGMTLYYDGQVHEYDQAVTLKVNGEAVSLDVPPVIIQDRTLVPSRGLFETLGATVEWKGNTRQVIITCQETEIILTVDAAAATVNGKIVMMDVPAKIINDRTMIPVRFVSEYLGLSVGWDGATKTVSVDQVSKFSVLNVSYDAQKSRVTVTASDPMEGVRDAVLTSGGQYRIVLDFPDAMMKTGTQKISTGSSVLTEVRCSQYRSIPYIGRLVLESSRQLPYTVSYSADRRQLYVDVELPEETLPEETPQPSPSVSPTQSPSGSDLQLNEGAKQLLVVIDPGHGGSDVGSVGRENGVDVLYEKDVNLAIANRANALLQAAGAKTYMTRSTDVAVDLYERPEIANQMGAALFLSVHNNAFSSESAHGTTVLYYPDGQPSEETKMTSQRFAQILQEELVDALDRYDRGITDGAEMVVIRKTTAPAVITEIAFVTNPEERELLMREDFQNKAAQALCRAVIRALNEMTQ